MPFVDVPDGTAKSYSLKLDTRARLRFLHGTPSTEANDEQHGMVAALPGTMSSLKEDLCGPGIRLVETHTAWVFVGPREVLKVKKPVDYGFLNFTTVERRRSACDAEVRLNARLAPDVYLGVVPIVRDASGVHRPGETGEVVDYAVRMRTLADDTRADVRLEDRRLGVAEVELLAARLAAFHASLDETVAAAAPFAEAAAIRRNVEENFEQAHAGVEASLSAREALEIRREQEHFLETREALFARRVQAGRVRDGHGDLRLEHVYFESEERPTVIDCIEFNDRFRYADVCADIAFLSMDMRRLRRPDLAEQFLAAYARESGDYELYDLVDFYEGYRAYVRGKVASLLSVDVGVELDERENAKKQARSFFLLALLEGRKPVLSPVLVAVGGWIASGKSTVSERIGRLVSAPVISADRTRKDLLGVRPTEPMHDASWSGSYSDAFTERVYATVLERADHVLASGRPVVLDASFRSKAMRDLARKLADKHGVRFAFVECRVSEEECKRRLAERARNPSVSDGRLEVFDDFVARFEPVTELSPEEHFVVDTSQPLESSLRPVVDALPTWPERVAG
jgi:aminoglycoside phosphotransferase family enzyme/predicted kinase